MSPDDRDGDDFDDDHDDDDDDHHDELVDLLIMVLDEAPPQPSSGRVNALRARAVTARRPRWRRAWWLGAPTGSGR